MQYAFELIKDPETKEVFHVIHLSFIPQFGLDGLGMSIDLGVVGKWAFTDLDYNPRTNMFTALVEEVEV